MVGIAHEVNQPLSAIVSNSHACHRWLSAEPPNVERAKITAERIIREVSEEYGREHKKADGVLKSLTTFVGGGGPRFWLSATPEARQPNYAQIVIEVSDKHDTNHLVGSWQTALMAGVPEARVDVRQLETGPRPRIGAGDDATLYERLAGDGPVGVRFDAGEIGALREHMRPFIGELRQRKAGTPPERRVFKDMFLPVSAETAPEFIRCLRTALERHGVLAAAGRYLGARVVMREVVDYRLVRRDAPANEGVVDWLLACPHKGYFVSVESESTDTL